MVSLPTLVLRNMHLHLPRRGIGSLDEDQVRAVRVGVIRHAPSPVRLGKEGAVGGESPRTVRRSLPLLIGLDDLHLIADHIRARLDEDEILHSALIFLIKGRKQPGAPVVVLEHGGGVENQLAVVGRAAGDVDLDFPKVGVARLDEDEVQFAVAGRVGHGPGAVVPREKNGRRLEDAGFVTRRGRSNVHFNPAAATVSSFDVYQIIHFAVTGEVGHHPGAVGLGYEGGSTLPDALLVLGCAAGDMNLDPSGTCVTSFDEDEILMAAISSPVSQGPHSICFVGEGRSRLEDTRVVGHSEFGSQVIFSEGERNGRSK